MQIAASAMLLACEEIWRRSCTGRSSTVVNRTLNYKETPDLGAGDKAPIVSVCAEQQSHEEENK